MKKILLIMKVCIAFTLVVKAQTVPTAFACSKLFNSDKGSHVFKIFKLLKTDQPSAQEIGLNIGDDLPDFNIPQIINAAETTGNTAEFKDQLLIIDFWATNCSGCVAALPKMEHLQKQFGSKIKILPVTTEAKALVLSFWKKNKYTKGLTLPSVVEDKIFKSYFKHQSIPHEVWVYKGKVIGITAADYVDAANIEKVLSGASVNWPVKNDFYVFDSDKPLVSPGADQLNADGIIKYTAISGYKEGVNSEGLSGGAGIVRDAEKKMIRAYFLNQPVFTSYVLNWIKVIGFDETNKPVTPNGSAAPTQPNEIIWEVADRSKYKFEPKHGQQQSWVRNHGICYEAMFPDSGQTDAQVYKKIIADLNHLLGLNVRWEKRREKVLVLVKTGSGDKFVKRTESNTPVTNIAYALNQQAGNPYVFNETGYEGTGAIPVKIGNWSDIAAVRKAIRLYGVDLKEEERLVDKFVFTEVKEGQVL